MPPSHPSKAKAGRSPEHEITLTGITHGGEAVGRLPSGKVCFVPYAIPGEHVRVVVTDEHRSWSRGRLLEVLEASPDRVEPPCPYFGPDRCGGCQLQHVAPPRQAELKRRVVAEQLERIGKLDDPPVADTVRPLGGWPAGYRNRARLGVAADGRLGFRKPGTDEIQPVDVCLLLHERTQALRAAVGDRWQGAEEVTIRAGLATGDRAVLVRPGPGPLPPLPPGDDPVAVLDAAGTAHPLRGDPVTVEEVAGAAYRVSATSFFQASTAGASTLVQLVKEAAAVAEGDQVLDLFAGVGLFSAALAAEGAQVRAVESHPAACADARANLTSDAEVVCDDAAVVVDRIRRQGPKPDVVVLDPPRRGAGPQLCRNIANLGAKAVVYVSCDPAALARDARALTDAGYPLQRAVPVDQFGHTAQVETVAVFRAAR